MFVKEWNWPPKHTASLVTRLLITWSLHESKLPLSESKLLKTVSKQILLISKLPRKTSQKHKRKQVLNNKESRFQKSMMLLIPWPPHPLHLKWTHVSNQAKELSVFNWKVHLPSGPPGLGDLCKHGCQQSNLRPRPPPPPCILPRDPLPGPQMCLERGVLMSEQVHAPCAVNWINASLFRAWELMRSRPSLEPL